MNMNNVENKYVALIDSVLPNNKKCDLKHISSCYLGVSLETEAFKKPKLNAIVEWIAENYKNCTVVVGDSIHRLTLQIINEMPSGSAYLEAYKIGTAFLEENRDLFSSFKQCNFTFVRSSDFQENHRFLKYKDDILKLSKTDPTFFRSIRKSADSFINRRRTDLQNSTAIRKRMSALSCLYIIEELALFSYLIETGIKVEIYPGSELPILKEIARGEYASVPPPLKERINIALKIKNNERYYL